MKTISIRLDERTLRRTGELAESENLERSAAIRQTIATGLEVLGKKIAIEKYSEGKYSLSEAAQFAGISAGEMIDLLAGKGVKANYSLKDAEGSMANIRKAKSQ